MITSVRDRPLFVLVGKSVDEWFPLEVVQVKDVIEVGTDCNLVPRVVRVEELAVATQHYLRSLFAFVQFPSFELHHQLLWIKTILLVIFTIFRLIYCLLQDLGLSLFIICLYIT